jgi:hypothetical protein
MAQKPLEAGTRGKAPMIGTKLPRAHYSRLRSMAAEQGLAVSVVVRQLIADGIDALDAGPPEQKAG